MQSLITRIEEILAKRMMLHYFQPIWRSDGRALLGFEALARFDDVSPEVMFATANAAGLGVQLDRLSVQQALRQGQCLPGLLFINIDPNHMGQSEGPFGSVGSAVATFRNRHAVVMEITEQAITDQSVVQVGVRRMRRRDIALALDDAGTLASDGNRLAWLRPRFVKIAHRVVQAWQEGHTQELHYWIDLARSIGADLVAEGIENREGISDLHDLGVQYLQGYALGRPQPATYWQSQLESEMPRLEAALRIFMPPEWARSDETSLLSVEEIGDIMYSLLPFAAVIVDAQNRVVGMNLRAERHFGIPLEHVALTPVEDVLGLRNLDADRIHVSAMLPSELKVGDTVSQAVLLHRRDGRNEPAHLTIEGIRIGHRAQSYKLFTLVTDMADNMQPMALGRDGLSGLPTRTWWEQEAKSYWQHVHGSVIFLDLDGLKQVNDLFGHEEGDRLIRDFAQLLTHFAEANHAVAVRYGGDEFLVVLNHRTETEANEVASRLMLQFSEQERRDSRIPATVSFGVASFAPGHLREAIAEADRRLYEEKGFVLASQSGTRLLLTAAGRRALWKPVAGNISEVMTLDVVVQKRVELQLRQSFATFIEPRPGLAVVEINAGRGQIGFLGGVVDDLGRDSQYLGVDRTGDYLTRLYHQWMEHPTDASVHFLRADATQLPIVSQSADLTLIAFALPFSDVEAILREMVRITRSDGQIAVAQIEQIIMSEDLSALWPSRYRPQVCVSADAFDHLMRAVGLSSIGCASFCGRIEFDTMAEASVELSSFGVPSHQLINVATPELKVRTQDLAMDYIARFYLFRSSF